MRRMLTLVPTWLALLGLVVGGAIVVLANAAYLSASEREKKAELAEDAAAILQPELQSNRALLDDLHPRVAANPVPLVEFSVSAWEAISKGGLLLGLASDRTEKLLQVYSRIYRANDLLAGLREHTMGVANAMANSATVIHEYKGSLEAALNNLDVAFSDLGMPSGPSDHPLSPPDGPDSP